MRNISPASLAKLATRLGTEPVCIVEVQWEKDGQRHTYSDKAVDGVEGRILTIDTVEDVINVSKSGTSQSVSITLDDTDGQLKQIFNNVDIHKKKVWLYQWFSGIPLSDKILLFVGIIASPVTWKEGDRTLSFSVISKSDDLEVGFSPEEGQFPSLPQGIIGSVWPLIFGHVMKLPAILVDDISYSDTAGHKSGNGAASVTKDGTGIKDPSLDHRINDNEKNATASAQLAQLYFSGYLLASFNARRRGELDEFDSIDKGKGYFSGLAKQYLAQGNKALIDAQKIRSKNTKLKTVKQKQEHNQKDSIGVTNGTLFPQGKQTKLNLAGALHEGYFLGDQFVITNRTHPASEQYDGMTIEDVGDRTGVPLIPRQDYFFADAGTPLRMGLIAGTSDVDETNPILPVRYIVAATLQVSVNAMFAYRTVNEIKSLVVVPSTHYRVLQVMFGTLPVTMIYMSQPLSSRNLANGKSEGWEDDIWVSCSSPIGPNTVDILIWLIETYAHRSYDATSFNQVRNYVAAYPMNFAVTDRPNVLKLISDIAYQARCIVWLKNDIFYIKYLAKSDPSVDTITEDDILEQSMEVSYTETEDLTTKLVAHWRADYKKSKQFAMILRYNISYYGILQKEYNFFCFNQLQLVQKAATFWLIREANTFKRLRIVVPISKINIETLDTVTINFSRSYIANGPIDCVVEEAKLNTSNYTVELQLWVPIRAGEMTKYLFAYMGDLTIGYYFPTADDIQKGRAGSGHDVPFNNDVRMPTPTAGQPDAVGKNFSGDPGNGGQVQTSTRPVTWGVDPTLQSDLNQLAPEILQRLDAAVIQAAGRKPAGTTSYQYDQQDVQDRFKPDTIIPRSYPGIVVAKTSVSDEGHAQYTVKTYQAGFGKDYKTIDGVLFVGNKDDTIDPGTGVIVSELFVQGADSKTETQYYMQVGGNGSNTKTYPCMILSGSGDTYQIDLYRNGTDEDPEIVEASQLQIANDETIPADSWTFVTEIRVTDTNVEGGFRLEYYIQVPVWL